MTSNRFSMSSRSGTILCLLLVVLIITYVVAALIDSHRFIQKVNNSICPRDKKVIDKVFNETSPYCCVYLYKKLCLKTEANLRSDLECLGYYGVQPFLHKCLPNISYPSDDNRDLWYMVFLYQYDFY